MINVNLDKAKKITHNKRREARAEEFKPLDTEATIPSMATEAEAKRQAVRDKYAKIQRDIDTAPSADELKLVYDMLGSK